MTKEEFRIRYSLFRKKMRQGKLPVEHLDDLFFDIYITQNSVTMNQLFARLYCSKIRRLLNCN